ncbi:MAG: cobalamin B12-binding domain-containing protein [Chlamydiae bacterium]|nr:cobalamin B12-binding domain-containing protein [Chlamydiota bacterium]MBI3265463.1 cobalamin B12-binding domain-containing protein [Chlamydiota bacterium]
MAQKGLSSIKILLAKVGLDGHDRGIKVIARALRDAGMDVIYSGIKQTPEAIMDAALQEGVDAIGISILSGAHMTLFSELLKLRKRKKLTDMLLIGGGIIPPEDIEKLEKKGVNKLWGPDTSTEDIIHFLKEKLLQSE